MIADKFKFHLSIRTEDPTRWRSVRLGVIQCLCPPPRVPLDFEFFLLLLLAGDVSLHPGPGVHGLRLGTVNALSMRDKAPAI